MSETKKHREFWIKDHKVARTETKGYLYDAFDLLPALDKSVGVIHVVEISALLEEKQKAANLIVGLQLLYAGVPKDAQNFIDQLIKKYGDV